MPTSHVREISGGQVGDSFQLLQLIGSKTCFHDHKSIVVRFQRDKLEKLLRVKIDTLLLL